MIQLLSIFLLALSASLSAEPLPHTSMKGFLSDASSDSDCCDDDSDVEEEDEDIIIMDEENTNDDEGVNN